MLRWLKLTVLLAVLTLSLLGCGTAADSSKEQKQDSTTTTKAAKVEPKNEQPADTYNAASENKTEQAAAQVNTGKQETQTAQSPAPASITKPSTNTSTNSNKNSTPPATAQTPAATTSVNTTPPPAPIPETKPAATVTFSIIGPKDKGTIMGATKVSVEDGDTIFTVLKRQKNILVDSKGSGASTYIEGINNIYEFDYGAKSGWVFKLNGASLTKSVGVVTVKEGDRIECIYTE